MIAVFNAKFLIDSSKIKILNEALRISISDSASVEGLHQGQKLKWKDIVKQQGHNSEMLPQFQ